MALQSYTLAVGNLQDDGSGNNYAVNQAVYILKQDRSLQPIFADLAGTNTIIQDGVNNVTDNRGQFTFFVDSGDHIASVGGIERAFTVTGSDYFNSKVDEAVNLIIESVSGRGAYYVVGSFEDGFSYTDINQAGTYDNGGTLEYYVYTGGLSNLPHTVTAGVNPTTDSSYARVNYNQSNQIINDDGSTAQDTHDSIIVSYVESTGKTAVENMLEGNPYRPKIGQVCITGGTKWKLLSGDGSVIGHYTIIGDVYADDFGLIKNEPSLGEHNTSRNLNMLATLLSLPTPPAINGFGLSVVSGQLKPSIKYGAGVYYFSNNPFKPDPSTYEDAVFNSDKVFGLKITGCGMESTIFELRKYGGFVGTANFYSNAAIEGSNSGEGGWKNITFEDMTFRSPYFLNGNFESMARRPSNDWYSWGSMVSGGWEKFFKFNRVMFSGFDEILNISGTSNVDEHHWTNCRFELIRENILNLNNGETVIHRFDSCDFEGLHGNFVKAIDGGWVVINGGSLILYPEFDNSGAVVRGEKVAVFNIQPNGSNLDSRAGVYKMKDVSVEKYDSNYQLVRITQTGSVADIGDDNLVPRFPASSVDVDISDSSFRVDTVRGDDNVNVAKNHEVVKVIGDVLARVNFKDCELNVRHFYEMVATYIEYSDGSYLKFTRPRLGWNPALPNQFSGSWEGGTLAQRCTTVGAGTIISTGASCITSPAWVNKSFNYGLDFILENNSVFNYPKHEKELPVKRRGEKLLSTGETATRTGNTLYLYEGATITGVKIKIPSSSEIDTGVVMVYAGDTLIHETGIIDLSSGFADEVVIPYPSRLSLTSLKDYVHVKWGGYSGTGTNVPVESEVLIKYI